MFIKKLQEKKKPCEKKMLFDSIVTNHRINREERKNKNLKLTSAILYLIFFLKSNYKTKR